MLYFVLMAPKIILDRLKGKRHPDLLQRLGFGLPKPDRPVIWIHGVSVGEIKAAGPLFKALKTNDRFFFVTATTATGLAEARRSLSQADAFAYLPIDFTWVVRKFVKTLKPSHFILIESDFWPNLLKELKKHGTILSLVSGKMSERSAKRFRLFAHLSKRLFSLFDHLCVQNEEHYQRFLPFADQARLKITGNLKLDIKPQPVTQKLELSDPVITISCTHAPEEEMILNALSSGPWTLLIAPRHPERFDEVAALFEKKQIPFSRWSQNKTGKLILVDAMGQLPICYAHSRLAILGGSFIDGIGGHNVLEPCLYGTPVFFGPYMQTQKEFVKRVLEAKAGQQLPIGDLRRMVDQFFSDIGMEQSMRQATKHSIEAGRGATQRTLEALQ
ncbi:MAG: hypothetical protein K1X28_01435 [Parachlamydiales bacterium]|nr:hypothetical protein [Parachlamydiales bacterium]